MTTYNISFTDPLRPEFQIIPGAFNGPGSATPESSLRLYGRGALEWGESVNENMLRLSENFASATPAQLRLDPSLLTDTTLQGQMWFKGHLYARDSNIPVPAVGLSDTGWWVWNYTTLVWDNMSAIVVDSSLNIPTDIDNPLNVNPALQIIGQYIYDIAVDKLYRWDQFYKEYAATWLERTHDVTVGPPTADPTWELLMWNGNQWVAPKSATVSNAAPTDPAIGDMWLDTSTVPPILNIWDGTTWRPLLYADGSMPWQGPGNLDMAGFRIVNLGSAVAGTDATNLNDVNAAITTALGGGTGPFMELDGSTAMTGPMDMGGFDICNLPAVPSGLTCATSKTYVDTAISAITTSLTGYVLKAGDTMTGQLDLIAPVAAANATRKDYVDQGLRPDSGTVGSPTAPKYFFSTVAPTTEGSNGDVWFQYIP